MVKILYILLKSIGNWKNKEWPFHAVYNRSMIFLALYIVHLKDWYQEQLRGEQLKLHSQNLRRKKKKTSMVKFPRLYDLQILSLIL